MAKERITNRQLGFILFMMRATVIIAFLPILTTGIARQDAWLSALIVVLGSVGIVVAFSLLDRRFPRQTIIEYSEQLLGRWPGKLFSLIFLWLFLQVTVVEVRIYGEVVRTAFLVETPLSFIVTIMILPSAICVYLGVEVLARAADFLFFLFILMLAAAMFIPLSEVNLNNLQPIMARGWWPIISGTLTPIALMVQIWVLGMFSPIVNKPKKSLKSAAIAIGAATIILVVMVTITIGVVGPDGASRSTFPLLTLIRSVIVSDFMERGEVLIIFSWGFGLFVSVATYLYSGSKGVAQLTGLDDYRSLVWPMSIVWILLAIHGFENIFMLNSFLQPEVFAPYGFSLLVGPLVLLWLAYAVKGLKSQ